MFGSRHRSHRPRLHKEHCVAKQPQGQQRDSLARDCGDFTIAAERFMDVNLGKRVNSDPEARHRVVPTSIQTRS